MNSADRRWSNTSTQSDTIKFPDFDPAPIPRDHLTIYEDNVGGWSSERGLSAGPNKTRANGLLHSERWAARKDQKSTWANGLVNGWPKRHNRQKSLTDAIRTIRGRQGSVTANAQEIAEALRAPVSVKLVVRQMRNPSCLSFPLIALKDALLSMVSQFRFDQYLL